jgi:phage shock protein C
VLVGCCRSAAGVISHEAGRAALALQQERAMQIADEIEKLNRLREAGTLTEEEFRRAKERLVGGSPSAMQSAQAGLSGMARSRRDRWIAGVCGGLAEATAQPAWLYRLLFTLVTLAGGAGILIYVLMWIFVPLRRAG